MIDLGFSKADAALRDPDNNFNLKPEPGAPIIGRHPDLGNYFLACGFTARITGSGGRARARQRIDGCAYDPGRTRILA